MPEPILDILIRFNGPIVRLTDGSVVMIAFCGKAAGPIFTGIVEPCGVDTQICGHLSARYMLTGKDSAGAGCHIYVENNGDSLERTVPTFHTDSEVLRGVLAAGSFYGKGSEEADGLHIRFYSIPL